MGEEKKGHPENRGADGEMVFEMAGGSSKGGFGLAVFVEPRSAKTFVGVAVVLGEIEIVLDERSTGEGVIADAIAADPGIEEREGEKKKYQE
jgi:hypothetical protein